MRLRTVAVPLGGVLVLVGVGLTAAHSADADSGSDPGKSSPPDTNVYNRPAAPEDYPGQPTVFAPPDPAAAVSLTDIVVSNTDGNLFKTETFSDSEPSIAVNPANTAEIVITVFSGGWIPQCPGSPPSLAPMWSSANGGAIWTKVLSIPAPPANTNASLPCLGQSGVVPGGVGAPNDQTIDYGRNNQLSGTFLTLVPNVYSGTTNSPVDFLSWNWLLDMNSVGVRTNVNNMTPDSLDQPWLLVNRGVGADAAKDFVYVAYDDFRTPSRTMRVAVARGTNPPNFSAVGGGDDMPTGTSAASNSNPGHRLAVNPTDGTGYDLFQNCISPNCIAAATKTIQYIVNRSKDGGKSWPLRASNNGCDDNASATPCIITALATDQPGPAPALKFGEVNALIGGIDHAAVDPQNGDLYVVYGGANAPNTNTLFVARIGDNGTGGLKQLQPTTVLVNGNVQAALPSIAVANNANHTIAVLYYTFDGCSDGIAPPCAARAFPKFTVHLALSTDRGVTFNEVSSMGRASPAPGLQTFNSPAHNTGNGDRQRIFGDYIQLKAVGGTFFGVFSGNRVGDPTFMAGTSKIDPIFFSFTP